MVLVATLLAGCASLTVVDTTPLPQSKLEPPGSETISSRIGTQAQLAVTTSEPLRQFLDNYPPRPPEVSRKTAAQKGPPRS
jgi:hypothetical protein